MRCCRTFPGPVCRQEARSARQRSHRSRTTQSGIRVERHLRVMYAMRAMYRLELMGVPLPATTALRSTSVSTTMPRSAWLLLTISDGS